MYDEDYFVTAENLIDTIFKSGHSYAKWFALECEKNFLFKSLPAELIRPVDEMFADSGAAEMLYMICSGIRYFRTKSGNGLIEDMQECTLEELYSRLHYWEQALEKHRAQEPSTKRKHLREHELWVNVCHAYLEEIHLLRDAITEKKANP